MFSDSEPYFKMIQLMAGIHIKTRRWTEKRIAELGMTYSQLGTLMALYRQDGVTQHELAGLVDTDTTTIMVLCNSLEKKGWLQRQPDKADKRVNRLILTDSGRSIYLQAMVSIQTGYTHMLSKTNPDELKMVLPFLEKTYGDIKELLSSVKRRR